MIVFGYESRENAIRRLREFSLSEALVRSVANSSLKKLAVHFVIGLVLSSALLEASERMDGFNAGVIYLLFSLSAFYVLFGAVAIYATYKAKKYAIRDVKASCDYYGADSDSRETFWMIHRELFPPDWR